MKETYTVKQAMERLGLKSLNTFLRWERKYPEVFVVVERTEGLNRRRGKHMHYDKAALDRFAKTREQFNQTMKETYTRQEAMKQLGLKNMWDLLRLEKRYPEAFVVVKRDPNKPVEFDKAILDQLADWRERFKQDNHEPSKA
jgi:hypothetical protein